MVSMLVLMEGLVHLKLVEVRDVAVKRTLGKVRNIKPW